MSTEPVLTAMPNAQSRAPAIAVDGLIKSYGARRVVDGLSFAVPSGEVFALLGPNGAGKTTTIEILEGYRAADAGSVRVLDFDPRRDAAVLKQRMGVMLQQGGVYPGITAREALELFAHFYERPADPKALLDRVGLTAVARTRYRRLSGGQQRRLALAIALVGQPELVFLDEPTAGMDPQARLLTWDVIRGLKARGATVLLTTHLMDEAERLADRIAIIDHGRLVALGSPAELLRSGERASTSIRLTVPADFDASLLKALPSILDAESSASGVYRLETADPAAAVAEVTAWLRDAGVVLEELRVGARSLEEVFLQLTGRELRE